MKTDEKRIVNVFCTDHVFESWERIEKGKWHHRVLFVTQECELWGLSFPSGREGTTIVSTTIKEMEYNKTALLDDTRMCCLFSCLLMRKRAVKLFIDIVFSVMISLLSLMSWFHLLMNKVFFINHLEEKVYTEENWIFFD